MIETTYPGEYSSIPHNHNVTGTCGKCGGPIIQPILYGGISGEERCFKCGAIPKPAIKSMWGPVKEME